MSELSSTAAPPPGPGGASTTVAPSPGASGDSHPRHREPPRPGVDPAAPAAAQPPAPAISFAGSLAGLVEGGRIDALVAGDDGAGHPVIRTATATFIAAIAEPLPPRSALTLEIVSVDTIVRAVVTARNGEALHPPPDIELTLIEVAGPAGAAVAPGPLAAGAEVAAVVLDQAQLPATATAATPPAAALEPGTTLVLRVLGIAPPGAPQAAPPPGPTYAALLTPPVLAQAAVAPTPQASQPTPSVPAADSGTTGPRLPATPATASGDPPPQPAAVAKPDAAAPAATTLSTAMTPSTATPAAATATPVAATGVPGQIVDVGTDGRVLIQSGLGLLAVDVLGGVERGTTVSLEIVARTSPRPSPTAAIAAPPASIAGGAFAGLIAPWESLKPVIDAIGAAAVPANAPAVANLAAGQGARFAAQVLFMVAALRGGDIRGWLGAEAVRGLERSGRANLIARLDEESIQLARFLDEPTVGEWRALAIPFLFDGKVEQIRMFMRNRSRRDGEDAEPEDVRFVVDLDLSTLGAMQLDGLVHGKRLDLILRSQTELPASMKRDIARLFDEALGTSGMEGSVIVEVSQAFPVSPLDELRRGAAASGEIVA